MKTWMRSRSFAIDVVLAVLLFLVSIVSLADLPDIEEFRPVDGWMYILVALQTLPLAWRRRNPIAVVSVVGIALMVTTGVAYPSSLATFGIALALYTVASELSYSVSRVTGMIVITTFTIWTAIGSVVYDFSAIAVVVSFVILAFPWLVGVESHRREQRAIELEARATRAEMTMQYEAADAIRTERTRVSRELHDVVAHEMTVMTIHAGAARRMIQDDPEEARRSLSIVEEAGRRGLTEMRRLLGVVSMRGEHSSKPQPGLSSLEALVQQIGDTGLNVTLDVRGDARKLPAGVDLNAYRVVQESLTNSARYAGPDATAAVFLDFREHELHLEVTDDGRGAAEGLGTKRTGHGIVGMRERIALFDGTFSAGPQKGGGFRVSATIPISQP